MRTQNLDLTTVIERLERLERHNRWMKRAGAAVLVLAGAVLLMGGQGQPQGKTREPEKFVLRDDKGNERAWLGLAKDGPVLRFRDEGGKERLWLGLAGKTPGLVLYDEQGKRRAALGAGKEVVSLILYDDAENRKAWLTLSKEGPALHVLGAKGGPQHAGLSVQEDGVAVWHHDKAGKVLTGVAALKSVPGSPPQGKTGDPLFPKPE